MSDNPTQTGMILSELPDEDLIKIFSYLDQKSQFNSMLVCRRFESLIGQTHQFFKNRDLMVLSKLLGKRRNEDPIQTRSSKRKSVVPDNFMPFRRNFGEVKLVAFNFSQANKNYTPLIENLEVFGSKVSKLWIDISEGYKNRFLDVLRLANNVQELNLYDVRFHYQAKSKIYQPQLNFPNLKTLRLIHFDNFEAIQEAFSHVASLKHLELRDDRWKEWINNWEFYQPLLFRQSNLRSLELSFLIIKDFEWKELNLLEKLTLTSVKFPQKEAFDSFTEFIKTLVKVSELKIDMRNDQLKNQNNYSEILKHVLSLKTLSKLTLFCEDIGNLISGLQVRNPAVTTLTTNRLTVFGIFPNLQQFNFENSLVGNVEITGQICLSSLTEIKIETISFQNLLLIKCPRLKRFAALKIDDYQRDSTVFESFAQNNPEIEELELLGDYEEPNFDWILVVPGTNANANDSIQLIKNLPKLRILKMLPVIFVNTLEIVKLIGENFGKLEHFEMALLRLDVVEVIEYFKKKLPDYKITVKFVDFFCEVIIVEKLDK
jgi:hypothetical protein